MVQHPFRPVFTVPLWLVIVLFPIWAFWLCLVFLGWSILWFVRVVTRVTRWLFTPDPRF